MARGQSGSYAAWWKQWRCITKRSHIAADLLAHERATTFANRHEPNFRFKEATFNPWKSVEPNTPSTKQGTIARHQQDNSPQAEEEHVEIKP